MKILETKVHQKGEADPAANAIHQTLSSKKKVLKGACYKCGKKGHWANKCTSKALTNAPTATTPSSKDLGQDIKVWGKRSRPQAMSSATVNNVELSSSPENETTIYFYNWSDISAECWLMDSGVTDHMTPWATDFSTYTPYKDLNCMVILGDGSTQLKVLSKGTIQRWCKTLDNYTLMEMDGVSGPLYPNTPNVLFCAFPRPASPTSSTYLVGCLSPT